MRRLFIFLLILISFFSNAQSLVAFREINGSYDLVNIDLSNDSVVQICLLPIPVYSTYFSSCYDNTNDIYYLCMGRFMYAIHTSTGIRDSINLNLPFEDQFEHIAFNRKDSKVYGVLQNTISLGQRWAVYDPVNNSIDTTLLLNPHAGTGIGCKSVFNPLTQRYIIQSTYLATVDITNGQTIINVPIQNQSGQTLDHIAFSCKDQMVYGLSSNPHTEEEFFATIDTSTGIVTLLNSSPLPVSFYKQYLSGSTIDNDSDIYYYAASGGFIYGIDIQTGTLTYSHNFGSTVEFLFVESASAFQCMTAEIDDINSSQFEVYPNPSSDHIFIRLPHEVVSRNESLILFNYLGEIIRAIRIKEDIIHVNISDLKSGIYVLKFINDSKVQSKIIIKE